MQQRRSCRVSLHVISTTATLCSVASQTLLRRLQSVQNAAARLVTGTRRHDHITPVLKQLHWLPVRQGVDFKTALLVYKAIQLQRISSTTASSSHRPAVAGYDRPTSTRALCHGPTRGSPTGVSQSLDHGSGTVCRPGFASPTMTLENFVGSQSRFCFSVTAAHSD